MSPAPSAGAPSVPADNGPTEIVTRPDPGIARGKWEAPRAAFFVVIALVVVFAILLVLKRAGVLKRATSAPKEGAS